MNRPVIEVIVSPRGEITIDAVDFVGADCEAATRFLEEALGTVAAKRRKARLPQPPHHGAPPEPRRLRADRHTMPATPRKTGRTAAHRP